MTKNNFLSLCFYFVSYFLSIKSIICFAIDTREIKSSQYILRMFSFKTDLCFFNKTDIWQLSFPTVLGNQMK